jgi:hypothetical protein
MTAHKVDFFLTGSARLQDLFGQAQTLLRLQRVFVEIAPAALAKSCKVAAIEQKTLVLFADNGAIAAKIKQLLPSLLKKFQQNGVEVTALQVQVQALQTPPKPPKIHRADLSDAAVDSLKGLSGGLAESPLKTALERMVARHAGRGRKV